MYAVSSSLGYSSLPALLDATASLPSLENRLDPPCGGDTRSVYPFPVADEPSAGAIDYGEPALFDPGIAGVSAHIVHLLDHPIWPPQINTLPLLLLRTNPPLPLLVSMHPRRYPHARMVRLTALNWLVSFLSTGTPHTR